MRPVFISCSNNSISTANILERVLNDVGIPVSSHLGDCFVDNEYKKDLYASIRSCSLFIAIIDGNSSNVFFDLGYAVGASKRVLLVCSKGIEPDFNYSSFPLFYLDPSNKEDLFYFTEYIQNDMNVKSELWRDSKVDQISLRQMVADENYLDSVAYEEFERAVSLHFIDLGFQVIYPGRNKNDKYVTQWDFIIRDSQHDFESIVEVKKFNKNSKIGVNAIIQLIGAMHLSNSNRALLVSASGFTSSATSVASGSARPIKLMTLDKLIMCTKEDILSLD